GHTDNQGDPALNLKLSQDRVNEVKKYLVQKGVNSARISTEGFGDTKPLASNDKEETRKLNRRVEFRITKK
ncbi:MAG TPA: OmpA family protein, partial [Hymenobacter sp.]|nr:OmpA family protein [Hymenobacter sp.]